MDISSYLIPLLILAFLLVFPIAFWAKSKFYPEEYKKDINKLSSTNFFVFVFVLILVDALVKIFLEKQVTSRNELLFFGTSLVISLISLPFVFRNAVPKLRRFFIFGVLLIFVLFVIKLGVYFAR